MNNSNLIFQSEPEHLKETQQEVINKLIALMLEGTISKILTYVSYNKDTLKSIYESIRKKKEVQTLPRATALSYLGLVSDKRDLEILISIQTAICYVTTQEVFGNGFDEYTERAFRASRMLATNKKYFDLLRTIECFDMTLNAKISYFTTLNEQCKKAETPGRHLIYDIHHLFSVFKSDARPRVVKKKKSLKLDDTLHRTAAKQSPVALDSDECKTKSFQSETVINHHIVNPTEYGSDSRTATVYYEVDLSDTKYVSSLYLQQKQARKVTQHMYKREKQLACDYRILTKNELHKFVEYYLNNYEDELITLIFMVLLTGRSIAELQKCTQKSQLNMEQLGGEAIHFNVDLPIHNIKDEIKELLIKSSSTLNIDTPVEAYYIGDIVGNNACDLENQCNERFKAINRALKTRFTIQRLQNAFSAYMNHHHVDSAEMAYLLGREIRQTPSCYYHQTSVGQLIKIHQDWLHYLFAKQNKVIKELKHEHQDRFGSRLVIRKKNIKKLFSILRSELKEPITHSSSISESHNKYVSFLMLMLNLVTGHRAVRHPYCFKHDFDLVTNRLFISDKEGRGTLSARITPLPAIVTPYLQEYNKHLAQLLAYESPYSSQTTKSIIGALESNMPYFFFLNEHQYVPVTPLTLSEQLNDILPLPLNWNRHFIRGYLSYHGLHTHLIDAFMGHSSNAGEPFAKYSALGTYDLKPIAEQLNKLLITDLGFSYRGLWGEDLAY